MDMQWCSWVIGLFWVLEWCRWLPPQGVGLPSSHQEEHLTEPSRPSIN